MRSRCKWETAIGCLLTFLLFTVLYSHRPGKLNLKCPKAQRKQEDVQFQTVQSPLNNDSENQHRVDNTAPAINNADPREIMLMKRMINTLGLKESPSRNSNNTQHPEPVEDPITQPPAEEDSNSSSEAELNIPRKLIFATRQLTKSTDNIFFLETSCATDKHDNAQNGVMLKPRQACAIFSTAKHNPSKNVFLLLTCALPLDLYYESPTYVKAVLDLPNFSVAHVNLREMYEDSPLADFEDGILSQSDYPVEHNSDIFRILLLYLFGGTYMDLDTVCTRPLDDLGINYMGAEAKHAVGTAVFNFEDHHPYLKEYLLRGFRAYSPSSWNSIGPLLATSVLKKVCNLTDSTNMTLIGYIPHCGIRVWNDKVFFPIKWDEWYMYWDSSKWPQVESLLKETYVVHMWNHMSSGSKITEHSQQPYVVLAERNCAPVFSASISIF